MDRLLISTWNKIKSKISVEFYNCKYNFKKNMHLWRKNSKEIINKYDVKELLHRAYRKPGVSADAFRTLKQSFLLYKGHSEQYYKIILLWNICWTSSWISRYTNFKVFIVKAVKQCSEKKRSMLKCFDTAHYDILKSLDESPRNRFSATKEVIHEEGNRITMQSSYTYAPRQRVPLNKIQLELQWRF